MPLYKQLDKLKANVIPILVGITSGALVGIVSAVGLGFIFQLSTEMIISLSPKSTTGAIAMELSRIQGRSCFDICFRGSCGYVRLYVR